MFFKSIQNLVESGARSDRSRGLALVDLANEMDAMAAWRGKVEQKLFKFQPSEAQLDEFHTTADIYMRNMAELKLMISRENYDQVVVKPVKNGILLLREESFDNPAIQFSDVLRRRIILMRTAKEVVQKWMPSVTKNLTVFVLGALALGAIFQTGDASKGDLA